MAPQARLSAAVTAAALMLVCTHAAAQQPAPQTTAPKPSAAKKAPPPDNNAAAGVGAAKKGPEADAPQPAELPDDLRAGHFLIYAGGGFAFLQDTVLPQNTPTAASSVGLGGAAQLQLGVGLNRFLVLGVDGSFAYAGLGGDNCASCDVMSIGTGLGLAFHPTQAFAFDPWVRYGVGYRYTQANFDAPDVISVIPFATSASEHALDFAKLSIGGDFYPDPLFGFGPYVEAALGLNRLTTSTPQFYANVQLGFRLAFDPLRAGTKITPGTLTASAY